MTQMGSYLKSWSNSPKFVWQPGDFEWLDDEDGPPSRDPKFTWEGGDVEWLDDGRVSPSEADATLSFQNPKFTWEDGDVEWLTDEEDDAPALAEAASHQDDFGRAIRAVARGLWVGVYDYYQAWEAMDATIRRYLPLAWYEGARECGIEPSELTPEERQALALMIQGELGQLNAFLTAIEQGSKANGGKLRPFLYRASMWAMRYQDARNQARVMANADQKLCWTWNPEKEHCPTCAKLNGKIKRASFWKREGVFPQNPPNDKLECKGWQCGCELAPTEERCSPGPLPKCP